MVCDWLSLSSTINPFKRHSNLNICILLQEQNVQPGDTYNGGCTCGKITFKVYGEPLVQFYCHCNDCSQYHSTHYVEVLVYPDKPDVEQHIKLTDGQEYLKSFEKDGQARYFCGECGTAVFNKKESARTLGTFPVLLKGFKFQPTMHLYCSQSKAYMKGITDGLPKFKDLPTELGGTGEFAVGKWQRDWSNSPARCSSPAPK